MNLLIPPLITGALVILYYALISYKTPPHPSGIESDLTLQHNNKKSAAQALDIVRPKHSSSSEFSGDLDDDEFANLVDLRNIETFQGGLLSASHPGFVDNHGYNIFKGAKWMGSRAPAHLQHSVDNRKHSDSGIVYPDTIDAAPPHEEHKNKFHSSMLGSYVLVDTSHFFHRNKAAQAKYLSSLSSYNPFPLMGGCNKCDCADCDCGNCDDHLCDCHFKDPHLHPPAHLLHKIQHVKDSGSGIPQPFRHPPSPHPFIAPCTCEYKDKNKFILNSKLLGDAFDSIDNSLGEVGADVAILGASQSQTITQSLDLKLKPAKHSMIISQQMSKPGKDGRIYSLHYKSNITFDNKKVKRMVEYGISGGGRKRFIWVTEIPTLKDVIKEKADDVLTDEEKINGDGDKIDGDISYSKNVKDDKQFDIDWNENSPYFGVLNDLNDETLLLGIGRYTIPHPAGTPPPHHHPFAHQ